MSNARYGWIADRPDHRDLRYAPPATAGSLPIFVNMRPCCPPVYDQGQLGSCTANAIAAAIEYDRIKQELPVFTPSRLFIYYNERAMEGTIMSDAGAQIRDGIKSVATQGDCPEADWPYDISRFAVRPPPACYVEAVKYRAVTYERVGRTLDEMQACLAADSPFVFGFTVHRSFESAAVARTGKVPMPRRFDRPVGGHAVMAVGYNDETQRFSVRNSWGTGWGDGGYFTMPYAYLTDPNLSDDFWTIKLVSA
jgi:C1A family cysteine protease